MKAILAAIEAKEAEIARLNIEIGALRAVYNQEAGIVTERQTSRERSRAPRSNVKSVVLDLLRQVGSNGLNAQIAAGLAKERNETLQIKSVSSLLSRLKSDGVVEHRGNVYILKEFAPREPSAPSSEMTETGGVVRHLRTSGVFT
ncbi:MAG: hypothetical protein MUC82_16955 [Cypionkella sp.]|nr:hypothetical protein [Cypionkella sp.]